MCTLRIAYNCSTQPRRILYKRSNAGFNLIHYLYKPENKNNWTLVASGRFISTI